MSHSSFWFLPSMNFFPRSQLHRAIPTSTWKFSSCATHQFHFRRTILFEPDSFIPFNTDSRHIYRENNFLNYILTPPVIKFFPGNKSEETCSLSRFSRIFLPLPSFSTLFRGRIQEIRQRWSNELHPPFFLSSSSSSLNLFMQNANKIYFFEAPNTISI